MQLVPSKKYFILFLIISLVVFPAIIFFCGGKFLSIPAGNPKNSDLIVILGGGEDERTLRGLELYKMKYETKLLLTGSGGDNFNPRAKLLISDGVSKEKIIYDTKSKNSWDEAVNTLAFIKSYNSRNAINASLPHLPSPISHLRSSINQMNSIIVITDPPHLLRVRYAWGKVFKHSGIKFTLVATEPDWWNAWKWWQNETSRKFVVTEYLKLAYFIYKYNFDSKYFDNGIEHGAKGIGETDNNDIGERLKIDEAVKKKWNDRIDKWNDYFGRAIDRSLRPVKKSP